jgi:hypothetical protein
MRQIFLVALLIVAVVMIADAQLLDSKGERVHAYYISFDASSSYVEDIRGEFIHVAYRDRIGKSETLTFSIYDFRMKLLKQLSLVKQFGQNYFDIQLADHGIDLEETKSYYCKLTNEYDETTQRTIRYTAKTKNDIVASILVDPKYLACQDPAGNNLVDFFGEVSGGNAPYKANWYVLNAGRTKLLYQPAHVVVESPGLTSSIEVDKAPEYCVVLHVTDACGNEQIASVEIICESNEKKVNTLFFQKLSDVILPQSAEPQK